MQKLYYSCGFGFRTFDLEKAKEYCLRKKLNIIHIVNDNLREIGYLFYDKKNCVWKNAVL